MEIYMKKNYFGNFRLFLQYYQLYASNLNWLMLDKWKIILKNLTN